MRAWVAAVGLLVALAGCGDDDELGGPSDENPPPACNDLLCPLAHRCFELDVEAYSFDRTVRRLPDGSPVPVCCSLAGQRELRDMGRNPWVADACGNLAFEEPGECATDGDCGPGMLCNRGSVQPALCIVAP